MRREELAGHKLLTLFDRAAARDFADVYVLSQRFGKDTVLARAAQIDAGFDAKVLADMIASLDRFTDDELHGTGGSSAADLRTFYAAWRSELTAYAGQADSTLMGAGVDAPGKAGHTGLSIGLSPESRSRGRPDKLVPGWLV